ncbi:efflux RND transporter periplasmic adaptor subunit [Aeromonas caviae]|uniref:efflux RND transporter periplasmic adaptor subunit n=1 Tax=Aeromonas caviae TaxID=648 RepID=UPI000219882B|nr:efflux RND transporter periplasmic adaptor subunit [Aeromonas caviae]MCE9861995.1 efflux RND transporter periplasmic adaptor subunit [Aeromonas caviae]NBA32564.1 efflux RND transporter periplasmic adaptor subunit [Aeromonas caviae]PZQ94988.1 MAG: efflux RND transporter periplasmic adaptor subunit [Aeromonas media]GJA11443.1 macrolide-specific efflux protein MacA [Aeromonas caviae]
MPTFSPRLFWLLPLCALALLLAWRPQAKAPASDYITASAETRDLEQLIMADGTLKARKQVSVGAQVSGQIKKLHVTLGQEVKQGELLVEIDDLPQQNALKDALAQRDNLQAQLDSKEATLRNARLAYQRQRQIVARGLGSTADHDSAKATLDETLADIRALNAQRVQAEIAVDTARVNLGYTRILAPLSGTVVAMPVEEGQTLNASQSTPTLLKIAQLDTMTVEARISEADVIKVRVGMPVYFTILGNSQRRFEGSLRAIEPAPDTINDDDTTSSSDSSAIYYHGLFEVPNQDGQLRISMTAQVYLVVARLKSALVIPAIALQGDQVRVIDDGGRISLRRVRVGLNNKVDAQILSGLSAGERVIVSEVSAGQSDAAGGMPPPMGM